jgi:hypothetical protein
MIKITSLFLITAINLAACNSNSKSSEAVKDTVSTEDTTNNQTPVSTVAFPVKEVIAEYLKIKNALVKDNSQEAANAGKELTRVLSGIDITSLSPDQAKVYQGLQDDLKEHSEHISTNGGKIDHQRSHFEMLSVDIADLLKAVGNGGETLYKDFCPMANDGKGAIWLSELKEIKNPYMGKKMSTCGIIKDTIK